jgi:1-acyl-sn-glycerol-3-phosphate acyltransferase
MLRILWLAIVAVFVTIPLSSATIVVAMFRSTSPKIDWIVRTWGSLLVKAAGIDLRVENVERIDPQPALHPRLQSLQLSRHPVHRGRDPAADPLHGQGQSLQDPDLRLVPRFMAINRAGFIPIDRKNRRTAVKSFDLAADRIRKGNTIVIFPEEGRSKTREMRPFQRGAFLLAIKSEKTIVPLAIDSTFDVFPVGAKRVKPGRVTIRVGTPIETAGRSLRDKGMLLEEARTQVETMLFGAPVISSSPQSDTE